MKALEVGEGVAVGDHLRPSGAARERAWRGGAAQPAGQTRPTNLPAPTPPSFSPCPPIG